jgi:hypothetical protein
VHDNSGSVWGVEGDRVWHTDAQKLPEAVNHRFVLFICDQARISFPPILDGLSHHLCNTPVDGVGLAVRKDVSGQFQYSCVLAVGRPEVEIVGEVDIPHMVAKVWHSGQAARHDTHSRYWFSTSKAMPLQGTASGALASVAS